jgi:hypothetical protein
MKIKLCPECGKHNTESAWSCVDCGKTLSLKTLIDTEAQEATLGTYADQYELSQLSPRYLQDAMEILDIALRYEEEDIIRCFEFDTPHNFGYIILTSHQLIHVNFAHVIQTDNDDFGLISFVSMFFNLVLVRFLGFITYLISYAFVMIVDILSSILRRRTQAAHLRLSPKPKPGQLSNAEQASRQAWVYNLADLESIDLAEKVQLNTCFMTLKAEFDKMDALSVTFNHPDTAWELYNSLEGHLKQPSPV